MPVILGQEQLDQWLDTQNTDTDTLEKYLCPYSKDDLQSYPVSLAVNNPRRDDPACVQAME
jgi:putative SOS response-associated peptidase YedK